VSGLPLEMAALLGDRPGRVLLHAGRDDDGCGRYSFVACDPYQTLEARGSELRLCDARGAVVRAWRGDPLVELDRLSAGARGGDDGPVPVAIGYLGYDLGRQIERLGPGPTHGDDLPDLWFGFYGAVWRLDAATGEHRVVGPDPDARAALERALAGAPEPAASPRFGPLAADQDPDAYRAQVARILEYIAAGDVYQVNLARRLVAPVLERGDPLALYAALLEASPAQYGGLLQTGSADIVSGSPERFLSRPPGASRLETRPIKGTRRRTGEPARDAALAAELAADPKERAEHLMIVDLERNDLGRVAVCGSVRVDAFASVVALPTLLHLVSTVSCRLRPGAGLTDILRATFPGGSITGAPKVRAMQIIDELEPARRGPYTGALGYIGADGALELAIAIRTAVITPTELRLHVGGGVVADSSPDRELEETEEKAAAWRAALARAVPPVKDG
jgi:para-aminobenzoate synthetase component I